MAIQQQTFTQSPVPPGEALDKLAPHIANVGERWMVAFESTVSHQQAMEKETIRVNEELNLKALGNQELSVRTDGYSLRRAQWIAGVLMLSTLLVFVVLIGAAFSLFMHDKVWPAAAFTAMAGALAWGFRSIMFGYLQKPDHPKGK